MTNQAEITGKVIFISPLQTISTTTSKKTVVIEYANGNRLETVPVEFINPGSKLDRVLLEHTVHIVYIPTGNQSKTDPSKFFVGLKGINIQIIQ